MPKKSVVAGTKAGKKATQDKLKKLTGKDQRPLTRREQIDQAVKDAGG